MSRLGYELEPAYVPETENRGIANTAPAREAVGVTPTTALSLVPVSRATSVLETAIMQIPVNVYRGNTQYMDRHNVKLDQHRELEPGARPGGQ